MGRAMHPKPAANELFHQGARFIVVGASNFAITYIIYIALLRYLVPIVAFGAAIAVAITYTTILNTIFVFRSEMTADKFYLTISYQIAYSVANIIIFRLVLGAISAPAWAVPFVVTCVVLPIHFLCSKTLALGKLRPDGLRWRR